MQNSTYSFHGIHVSYLLCSLYILSENHNFFKTFSFKNDIYPDKKNGDNFYIEVENFNEFYRLVNKPSVRRTAFRLIKPILALNNFPNSFDSKNNLPTYKFDEETFLLKKYLKKFKYVYYRYFFYQSWNMEIFPVNSEINVPAIKILFLLAGV